MRALINVFCRSAQGRVRTSLKQPSRKIKIAIPVAGCSAIADNVRNESIRL